MQAAVPDHGIALQEGVVIAPQQGFAYLMRSGGIDAVDLASGAVRWHAKSAAKPLALAGDRLVAQADSRGGNALKLVVLDARSGTARDSVRIPLPAGVAATVVDGPGTSFRVRADSAGASKVVVQWQATKTAGAGPLQGYLPAENDGAPAKALAPKIVSGQTEIDLGAALKMNASRSAPAEGSAAETRDALQELRTPAVAAEGRQLLSADGRHVLVIEPINAAEFTLERYRWTVYERESGARLGSVSSMVSAAPFLVVGTTLYYREPSHGTVQKGRFVEAPPALRAVNLQTGAEMWKSAISETAFQGPFPP
ncbi:MAG TPA: hypothetical protein VIC28_03485 [Thermoanaerobaculia bacterium]